MRAIDLRKLLLEVRDTRELVVTGQPPETGGQLPGAQAALFAIWSAARAEANIAYDTWRRERGAAAYAVYRAAEDRADAAEEALAAGARWQRAHIPSIR